MYLLILGLMQAQVFGVLLQGLLKLQTLNPKP